MKIIIIGAASHGKGAIKELLEGLDKLDYPLHVEIENLSYAHLSLPEAGFTLKPGTASPVEFKSFAVLSRSLSSLSAIAYMNRNDSLARVCIEAAEGEEEAAAAKAAEEAAAKEKAEKEEQAKADQAAEEALAAEKAAAEKAEKEKAKADKAKADADAKAAAKAKAADEAAAKAAEEAGDNKAEGSEPAAKATE